MLFRTGADAAKAINLEMLRDGCPTARLELGAEKRSADTYDFVVPVVRRADP
jgi:hypothetical protein